MSEKDVAYCQQFFPSWVSILNTGVKNCVDVFCVFMLLTIFKFKFIVNYDNFMQVGTYRIESYNGMNNLDYSEQF